MTKKELNTYYEIIELYRESINIDSYNFYSNRKIEFRKYRYVIFYLLERHYRLNSSQIERVFDTNHRATINNAIAQAEAEIKAYRNPEYIKLLSEITQFFKTHLEN